MGWENIFYQLSARLIECASEYTFKKQTAEKKEPKKAKETKEEKITSPEN